MTMKTPEQWTAEVDESTLTHLGPFMRWIESIQVDARAEAESERDKARAANKLLVEALEFLMDMQNGPPLVKWEADWNKAMQQAKDALAAVKQP